MLRTMTRTIGILYPAKMIKDRAAEATEAGFQPFGMQCSEITPVEHILPDCDTVAVRSLAALEACHGELKGKVWSEDQDVMGVMRGLGMDVSDACTGRVACVRAKEDPVMDGADDIVVCECPEVLKGSALLHIMIALKRGELDTLVLNNAESADLLVKSLDDKYGIDDSRYYLEEHVKVVTVGPTARAYMGHIGIEPDLVLDDQPLPKILERI